jgi:hypothetical protein
VLRAGVVEIGCVELRVGYALSPSAPATPGRRGRWREGLREEIRREDGELLAKTVKRGGDAKWRTSQGARFDLPDGITWNDSSRWQKLAMHVPRKRLLAELGSC